MQRNKKKLYAKLKVASTAIVIAILVTLSTSYIALAGGTSGPGGPVGGGGCKMSGTGTWVDTCFGGMWKYYPTTENYIHVEGTKSGNVPSGDIIGCGVYGGYYRLALERFHLDSYSGTGIQVGLVRVDQFSTSDFNGKATYRLGDWQEIRDKFDVATTKYNLPTTWAETGYFCWNDDWECDPTVEICGPEEPDEAEGNGYFYATSEVEVKASDNPNKDIIDIGTYPQGTPAEDNKVAITFSTDYSDVTVRFRHKLHYVLKEKPTPAHGDTWDGDDTFTESVYTDWTVSGAGTGSGQWSLTGDEPKSSKDMNGYILNNEGTYTITGLVAGETRKVCQRISYNPKNYTFKTVDDHHHTNHDGDTTNLDGSTNHDGDVDVHDSWDWGVDSRDGQSYSEACVIVYRPPDSDKPPYNPGGANSDNDNDIMYAGEDTKMSWSANGETAFTRRLVSGEAILYLVKENVGNGETEDTIKGYSIGNNRSGSDACGYYTGKVSTYYCRPRDAKTTSYPARIDYFDSSDFAVADYVGAKFCLSYDFKYEYRYGWDENYDGTSYTLPNVSTQYKDYWRVYNASCRTIAKKPSSAVWNGSLMTSGGLYTPLAAPRHTSDAMNSDWKLTADLNDYKLYGSWTEHLDVIGKNVNNHGSGSKMYNGGIVGICNDVDLTIANTSCSNKGDGLGDSGITNNSAYITKLETYLKNDPQITTAFTYIDHESSNSVMSQLTEGMTGTTIVRHSGDLNITHNITTAPGPYSDIYQIPQVIIFVDGNVNISSNVERIDAWLIVTNTNDNNGVIDTCSSFTNNSTPAYVDMIHQPQTPPDCSRQLVFNGPVRARKLLLKRSFGADNINKNELTGSPLPNRMSSDKQVPGEIFNLRADTYLWAYAQAGRYNSSYTESYSRELPPRY